MQHPPEFDIRFKPQSQEVSEAEIHLLMTVFAEMVIEMNMLEAASKD